jgi:hypothetical protein
VGVPPWLQTQRSESRVFEARAGLLTQQRCEINCAGDAIWTEIVIRLDLARLVRPGIGSLSGALAADKAVFGNGNTPTDQAVAMAQASLNRK